jgi:radical SAM superfamily enzyme YgiQ (UPF0313 family)
LELIDKGCKLEEIQKGIQVLHESGILVMGNVIIGANLQNTLDEIIITIKKTREMDLDLPSFTLLTPFPATDFYKELKQQNLLLTEDYSKYNWLTPVIKTPNLTPQALKYLLFLGFFYINYYAGGWIHKLKLFYRGVLYRGWKYSFHPIRFFKTALAYYTWRCIVHENLKELGNKIHQIKYASLEQMKELKQAILDG